MKLRLGTCLGLPAKIKSLLHLGRECKPVICIPSLRFRAAHTRWSENLHQTPQHQRDSTLIYSEHVLRSTQILESIQECSQANP